MDIKVWYKLTYLDQDANVHIHTSPRKVYLMGKQVRFVETGIKIDPTKPFFGDSEKIRVELEVTERQPTREGENKTKLP